MRILSVLSRLTRGLVYCLPNSGWHFFFISLLLLFRPSLLAAVPWLQFPTANHALLDGRLPDFYMFVDRDFEGEKSYPWEGGQYGLVRSPKREGGRIVYTLFHEGIDIKPVRRNSAGEPLDDVLAVANGVVVHVSAVASQSNYGKYVVLEHAVEGVSIYTLYAHLKSVAVVLGQYVQQGEKIGELGYTGAGLDRERAHLHFEVCLMLNQHFDEWANREKKSPNDNLHGIYNGINLQGVNPAALLLAVNAEPDLSLQKFLMGSQPMFQLTINTGPDFDLVRRYPFLVVQDQWTKNAEPLKNRDIVIGAGNKKSVEQQIATAKAWSITFSRDVVPIKAEPLALPVKVTQVRWLSNGSLPLRYLSRGLITGTPAQPKLTPAGARFVDLLTFQVGEEALRSLKAPPRRRALRR